MIKALSVRTLAALCAAALVACGSASAPPVLPPGPSIPGIGVFDQSTQGCTVSHNGLISYRVPTGLFSPIDVRSETCAPSTLGSNPQAAIPAWAVPNGPTQAVFIATSLQQAYSVAGMQSIENAAVAAHVPVTWMIGNSAYLANANLYNAFHAANGDDVEVMNDPALVAATQKAFPWYVPTVSVEGGGHERNIAGLEQLGETGFWGIAWNSHGIDGNSDMGAPWGTYCADPTSYKRPLANGTCPLLAFEWTARDLTRAYLSGREDFFSTDPDDLQQRAGFTTAGAIAYVQRLVDAYAAAGQTQGLVMMSQQESAEDLNPGDPAILQALYTRAVQDGMHPETLAQANQTARGFSALPRAVAFPYIPGGNLLPSVVLNGATLYPATIDYHDDLVGMTFLAGHTLPTRVFPYALDPTSTFNVPLAQLPAAAMPTLTNVAVAQGTISFQLQSSQAMHFGLALWSDPTALGISGPGVTPAGRAGVVLTFQLQSGTNDITFACPGCTGTTFDYAT